MITGAQIATSASALVGTPFHNGGRNSHGVDCLGVPVLACACNGISLPAAKTSYGRRIGPDLIEWVGQHCAPSSGRPLGALALFQFDRDPHPQHAGVLTACGIVHAHGRLGRVVEHGLRAQWARWLHSVWLLPGVEYP